MIQDFLDYLDGLQFQAPDEEFWATLWPRIMEIVRDPTSDVVAATLIVAIVSIMLLMIALAITYFLLGVSDEEDEVQVLVDGGQAAAASTVVVRGRWVDDPLRYHKRFLWVVGTVLVLFLATGVTTQSTDACMGCHEDSPHQAGESDPHNEVSCVGCHESTGTMGSVTTAVLPRAVHIVQGITRKRSDGHFGRATSRACIRCHADSIEGILENEGRALRMSHKEPLAAGATCLYCHRMGGDGRVTRSINGMDSCLRCHDGIAAPAECSTCHSGDPSKAVVARRSQERTEGRQLVSQPDCYSCHETKSCDACHGVRLPHPENYVMSHMRAAAEDFWNNDGKTCVRCHNENQRSCYAVGCHEFDMPLHGQEWRLKHQKEPRDGCEGCHNRANQFESTCDMCH